MRPASDRSMLDSLRRQPALAPVAAEILYFAVESADLPSYLGAVLPSLLSATGGTFVAAAAPDQGSWNLIAQAGARNTLPVHLLADVLDAEAGKAEADWAAVPLGPRTEQPMALTVRCGLGCPPGQVLAILSGLAAVLSEGICGVLRRQEERERIGQLETILAIAQQWNQTRELLPLLAEIAQAAVRLLGADRASIFLWDKRTHTLVGRPALGVRGGELRIADDRGVVGQVVRTGQPLRIDAATEPERIDRRVDTQTGYQTRSLLCVPLRGKSGELFGAFEAINKQAGAFTSKDEAALVELAAHAAVALENAQDRQQLLSDSRQMTEQAAGQVQFIGRSPAVVTLRSVIQRVAETELAVLILGENGTGKEVVAQSVHYLSGRRDKPFIPVNCAAIPDALAESELFGHEKGAFTDARETRAGKFELASNGTLFLDEIGDLSLAGQAKLLRVLEERVFVRVGGSTPIATDARVLAATNQNLGAMVREKRFREDLFYRLNVVTIEIPPLRDRPDDILLLAGHFLEEFCKRARRKTLEISPAARDRLLAHRWPGNVRELRNLIERLAYLSPSECIEAEDLAFLFSPRGGESPTATRSLSAATDQFQIDYIKRAITQSGGNMSQAATLLGLHRSNLYRKMRQLGVAVQE